MGSGEASSSPPCPPSSTGGNPVIFLINTPPTVRNSMKPDFSVSNKRSSERGTTAQGRPKFPANFSALSGVVVFAPAILVCPAKAGLYLLLGFFVSTGGNLTVSFTRGSEELSALQIIAPKKAIAKQSKLFGDMAFLVCASNLQYLIQY